MPGIELATAYVNVVPSTRDLASSLKRDLVGPLGAAGAVAGKDAAKGFGGMSSTIKGIGSAIAAIGIASFLKDSVDKAMAAEKSWAQLRVAVDNTGASFDSVEGSLKDTLSAQSKLSAFSGGQLRDGLTALTQTTGDVSKAQELLGLTTDLARAKNMDMATAAKLVGKVAMGNTSALTRYGIVLKKGATATEALAAMQKKFGGAAEAYGNTTQGSMDKATNSVSRLQTTIGTALLPTMGRLADKSSDTLDSFGKLPQQTQDWSIAIGAAGVAATFVSPYLTALGKGIAKVGASILELTGAGAVARGAGAEIGIGFSEAAGGARLATVASNGFGYALGGIGSLASKVLGPVGAVLTVWQTWSQTQSGNEITATVLQQATSFDALRESVDAGQTKYQALREAMDRGVPTYMTAADKARLVAITVGKIAPAAAAAATGENNAKAAADGLAKAMDALDSETVSYVRNIRGVVVASTSQGAAQRDLADKTIALTHAQKAYHDDHVATAAALKKYGSHSIEYKDALATEKGALLKAKDATNDLKAAQGLLSDRTRKDGSPGGNFRKYSDEIMRIKDRADKAAKALHALTPAGQIGLPQASYAAGTITHGAENAWIGEDGEEVVIPVGNPKYRGRAKGLLAYAMSKMGVGPKLKGDTGEGDLATEMSGASSRMSGGMGTLKNALARIRKLSANLGPVGKALSAAKSAVGDPYVWGAAGPNAFDCSGLDSWILGRAGFNYGRFTTSEMPGMFAPGRGNKITMGLVPGHHTGIQVAGQWFEAPHTGANVRDASHPSDGPVKTSWPRYLHIPGFAQGGVVSGPKTGYPVMLHGIETITPGTPGGDINVTIPVYLDGAVLDTRIVSITNDVISDSVRQARAIGGYRG